MTAITVRRLLDGVKEQLRLRAAAHGRSMEAEVRAILIDAVDRDGSVDLAWVDELIGLGEELGGVELSTPADEPARAADFGS